LYFIFSKENYLFLFSWIGPGVRPSQTCNCHGHSTYCSPDGRCQVCIIL
jgi:hypothetical protein